MVHQMLHSLFEPRGTADRRSIAKLEEIRSPEPLRTSSNASRKASHPKGGFDLMKPVQTFKSYKTMLLSRREEQREAMASLPSSKASATAQPHGIIPTKISYIPMVKESVSERHRRSCGRRRAPKNRFALSQAVNRRKTAEGVGLVTTTLVEEQRVPVLGDDEIGADLSVERDFEERSRMVVQGQGERQGQGQKVEALDVKQTKFKQDEEIATRVMMQVDSSRLSELKAEFTKQDDGLSLEEFVRVMNNFQGKSKNYSTELNRVSELVELFDQVDINCDGTMEWDEFSSFIIDASTDRDSFRVDNIKEYKATPVRSIPRRNLRCFKKSIEHVAYLKELDKVLVSEESSPAALVLDGTTYEKVGQLNGHAGMVHQACHLQGRGAGSYIVTCANDSTIGFFEPERYSLCQRIPTAEVQMSVEYTGPDVDKVFTGGVDGAVNIWHPESLANLCRTCSHKDIVMDLHCAASMDIMASASLDGKIGLWDLHTGVLRRWLTGHRKGVFSLSHSADYRFVVSAGFEHEPVVWNPYVRSIVCRMSGHTASLVGVHVVPNSPQIISADSLGIVKVWDIRNFGCVQSLSVNQSSTHTFHEGMNHIATTVQTSDLTSLGYDVNHKRIILGNYRLHIFDYEQQLDPFITDKLVTIQTLFIPNSLTLITATEASIKLWDAEGGRIIKVYRNLSSSQITAAALEPRKRKFAIGDHDGNISVYNVANGNFIQNFSKHASEIVHLGYLEQANVCLSVSLDGVTRLHHMEGDTESNDPQVLIQFNHQVTVKTFIAALQKNASSPIDESGRVLNNFLRKKQQWEKALKDSSASGDRCFNVCAAAESDRFGMIATAATDFTICLYAIQSSIVEGVFFEHKAEIISLVFLEPYPVLISADADGILCLWSIKTTGLEPQLLKSMNLKQEGFVDDRKEEGSTITCVMWESEEDRLYIGDDAGHVRVFNFSGLDSIQKKKAQPVEPRQLRLARKRRSSIAISANLVSLHSRKGKSPLIDEGSTFVTQSCAVPTRKARPGRLRKGTNTRVKIKLLKILEWEAHKACIRSITKFKEMNAVATSSYDKMCKFWSFNGELAGTLYQGSDENKFADKEWIVNVDREKQNAHAANRAKEVLASIFSMSQEPARPRGRRRSSMFGSPTGHRPSVHSTQSTRPTPPPTSPDFARRFVNAERSLAKPETGQ